MLPQNRNRQKVRLEATAGVRVLAGERNRTHIPGQGTPVVSAVRPSAWLAPSPAPPHRADDRGQADLTGGKPPASPSGCLGPFPPRLSLVEVSSVQSRLRPCLAQTGRAEGDHMGRAALRARRTFGELWPRRATTLGLGASATTATIARRCSTPTEDRGWSHRVAVRFSVPLGLPTGSARRGRREGVTAASAGSVFLVRGEGAVDLRRREDVRA